MRNKNKRITKVQRTYNHIKHRLHIRIQPRTKQKGKNQKRNQFDEWTMHVHLHKIATNKQNTPTHFKSPFKTWKKNFFFCYLKRKISKWNSLPGLLVLENKTGFSARSWNCVYSLPLLTSFVMHFLWFFRKRSLFACLLACLLACCDSFFFCFFSYFLFFALWHKCVYTTYYTATH